jgi:hypothetical protein
MSDFDFSCVSDLYKDAYGSRPSTWWFQQWNSKSLAEKHKTWDTLVEIVSENIEAEKEHEARALRDFEAQVANLIELGAGDRATALRWMTSEDEFYNVQCVEHWVWERDILFTEEGRQLVKDLMEIVTFKEYDFA